MWPGKATMRPRAWNGPDLTISNLHPVLFFILHPLVFCCARPLSPLRCLKHHAPFLLSTPPLIARTPSACATSTCHLKNHVPRRTCRAQAWTPPLLGRILLCINFTGPLLYVYLLSFCLRPPVLHFNYSISLSCSLLYTATPLLLARPLSRILI
jgi:hypothetical protein